MNGVFLFKLIATLLVALGLAIFQYVYKARSIQRNTRWVLIGLRTVIYWALLLLLLNPIYTHTFIETEKPILALVIDGSSSIKELNATAEASQFSKQIQQDADLQARFEVQSFQITDQLKPADQLQFSGPQSRLDRVGTSLKERFRNRQYATILATDGNQTSGESFVYTFAPKKAVFPVVLGDTTEIRDLKIAQLHVNRYAFHHNRFPVELFIENFGNQPQKGSIQIRKGSKIYGKTAFSFGAKEKSKIISLQIPADQLGVQVLEAELINSQSEKNTQNNHKTFSVEVLEEQSKIALVSSFAHPDLGAIKRSIESNAQRKVELFTPQTFSKPQDYAVIICYQPNRTFANLLQSIQTKKWHSWIITGSQTDFALVQNVLGDFTFKLTGQNEAYNVSLNPLFSLFAQDDIGFVKFPPLEHPFGIIQATSPVQPLLDGSIHQTPTSFPMLSCVEKGSQRTVYLFGENCWKWRASSFVQNGSFEQFDQFFNKLVHYAATQSVKKNLVVTHEPIYQTGNPIEISAQYFNKNYEIDPNAQLVLQLQSAKTKKKYAFMRSSNAYKVTLDDLEPGKYQVQVTETRSGAKYNGTFTLLNVNVENQCVNANWPDLKRLAQQTAGKSYVTSQWEDLKKELLSRPNYTSIQREQKRKSPLIEWEWLLIGVVLLLTGEWFYRKYNGLL
ncbi:MAG: hypothetical protein CFE24_04325 [Flavobacterium sp. BFFFF2]|nr:MAG: hypothetical protein CFE24_04325 [Flavobacterium sp. BFFFF2]